MTSIRERAPSFGRAWWSPFLAGAAAGLVAGVLLGRGGEPVRRRPRRGRRDEDWRNRWRGTWEAAVDGASEGLAAARDLVGGPPVELDVPALQRRMEAMAGSARCRVRLLGDGIVEVVGSCDSEDDARALLAALAAEPGVEVVVNRVWTPTSGSPAADAP